MALKLLTTGQAAILCSVTRDTVLKWICAGRLPARRTAGGHHRIRREDLEKFCQNTSTKYAYYQKVACQDVNVLVVTDDEALTNNMRDEAEAAEFNLGVVNWDYDCSALLNRFRPDYIVVDCRLGVAFTEHIARRLDRDPRVPLMRLILGGKKGSVRRPAKL